MALITVTTNGTTLTASTIGSHHAFHPAVVCDEFGSPIYDVSTWVLVHAQSDTPVLRVRAQDPYGIPGESVALDYGRLSAFVEWLERVTDCGRPLDLSTCSPDVVRVIDTFLADPNDFTAPPLPVRAEGAPR